MPIPGRSGRANSDTLEVGRCIVDARETTTRVIHVAQTVLPCHYFTDASHRNQESDLNEGVLYYRPQQNGNRVLIRQQLSCLNSSQI